MIEGLNKQLSAALEKAEQGSMQAQGEVQELAIEEWLRHEYPHDEIEEVKKGARGADCVQTVRHELQHACGVICFESKRTKTFQKNWIDKLKNDMRDSNADIGVIVSEARPTGYERAAMINGVWVCSYQEFKSLTIALRNQLIEISRVTRSQTNQESKVQVLWSYLQSNEFRQQVEAIVDGFTNLREELEKEKRQMNAKWKRQEKQINNVLKSTTEMYGSITGIAGPSIQVVNALEFDEVDEARRA